MKTMRIALAAAVLLGMVAGVAQAGGQAKVSVLSAPKQVVAGKSYDMTFSVRPNWQTRKSLEPTVRAVCGDREITFAAAALKASGQYKATFSLPAEGEWTITVDSRYCHTVMTPLVLKAEPSKAT